MIPQRNNVGECRNRTKPTLFALAEFEVIFWGYAGEFFKGPDKMALIGIAIGKGDIAELFELPVVQLLKGIIEL